MESTQSYLISRSTYHGIEELGWENGQPSTHDTVWVGPGDTLESMVHQATCHNQKPPPQNIKLLETEYQVNQHLTEKKSIVSSTKYCGENLSNMGMDPPIFTKKRGRSSEYYDQCRQINNFNSHQDHADMRSCASAAAAFCGESRDNNTTMTTWPSFESPRSMTTKFAEDSALHAVTKNPDEDIQTKNDTNQSKRSRTVAVHNQSERNRRDRINQRMETLQKLVPNTSKTDKASMLDKVIEYVKQLEAQVHMSGVRNMPNTMMHLGMQEQLQMSPLDQMGMGVGLGMNMVSGINMGSMQDMTTFAQTASQPLSTSIHPHLATTVDNPTFIPPQSMVPTVIPTNIQPQSSTAQGATNTNPIPFTDPYSSAFDPFSSAIDPYSASDPYSVFLAQSMNMDLDNKMEAPVCQQVNLATEALTGASNTTHMI